MDTAVTCFRCGGTGHWAESETCPWLVKAGSRSEHEQRIDSFRDRYWDGEITEWQKRRWIAGENRMYYGDQCKPELRKT